MLKLSLGENNKTFLFGIIDSIVSIDLNFFQIKISKTYLDSKIEIFNEEFYELCIHIEIEKYLKDYYEIELIEISTEGDIFLLKFSYSDDVEIYQMIQYIILMDWIKEKKTDWRVLSTINEKKGWLLACFKWSGIYIGKLSNKEFVINFKEVNNILDFYCLLGEVLLGYRGYVGKDKMGFDDCIQYIYEADPNHSNKLIFENLESQSDELNIHFKILKNFGFKITTR